MDTTASDPRLDRERIARTPPRDRRSLAGLFSDLWRETTTLVHEEAELAKAEMSGKVDQVMAGAGSIAAGGAVLFAGFLAVLVAATNGLALFLPADDAPWLAPLIVGLIVMAIGYAVFAGGKSALKARNLKPTRSMDSLRQDGRIVKEHLT
jgi:Putative Actinobacterial Holin-X, holin superfamily III